MHRFLSPRAREIAVVIGRKLKRAGDLAASLTMAGFGAGVATISALYLRLPDTEARLAIEAAKVGPMSVTDQRDMGLIFLGVGVVIFVWGAREIEIWFRRASGKTPSSDGDP